MSPIVNHATTHASPAKMAASPSWNEELDHIFATYRVQGGLMATNSADAVPVATPTTGAIDDHAKFVACGGGCLLGLVPGGGLGEDEAQLPVAVGKRANLLAGGDGDGQAGDSGYGRGAVPAVDGAQHARARYGEHVYSGGPGRVADGRDGLSQGAGQDEFFQGGAA